MCGNKNTINSELTYNVGSEPIDPYFLLGDFKLSRRIFLKKIKLIFIFIDLESIGLSAVKL